MNGTQKRERAAAPPSKAAAQRAGSNTDKTKGKLQPGGKKSQAKKRSCVGGNFSFYFENGDPCIGVESSMGSDNISVHINSRRILLDFSIPRRSFQKLFIAAQKYLESGKRSLFCGNTFFFGECGDAEEIPEEEIFHDITKKTMKGMRRAK